jgi:hypothetical protein
MHSLMPYSKDTYNLESVVEVINSKQSGAVLPRQIIIIYFS